MWGADFLKLTDRYCVSDKANPPHPEQFLSTFNSKFSLDEVEAFINDESTQPDGVLDFPE